jgi:putative restriction endonuclease
VDDELFEYLQDISSRIQLTEILISKWFPTQTTLLKNLCQVDEMENIQLKLFEKGGAVYTIEDVKDQDKTFVRNSAFRRNIVSLYQQNCALCRLKIISQDGQDIVDGAHIKPFSEFHDDRFDNGIALCKNHHWAFDRGWLGVNDDYKIIVPPHRIYEETPVNMRSLQDYNGEDILLPNEETYNPRVDSLQWHREFWKIA